MHLQHFKYHILIEETSMQPQPTPLSIDPAQLEDISCDQCGDLRFEQIVLMKKVPKVISNTGQEGIAPIPVFACLACGFINNVFLPPSLRKNADGTSTEAATETSETSPVKSSLILES